MDGRDDFVLVTRLKAPPDAGTSKVMMMVVSIIMKIKTQQLLVRV